MCDQEKSLNSSTFFTDDGATTDGYQTVDSRKQKKRKKRSYCDCEDVSYLKLRFNATLSEMKAQIDKMQAQLDKALKEKAELEEKFKDFSYKMETETTAVTPAAHNIDFPPLTNNKGMSKTSAGKHLPALNLRETNKVINEVTNKVINDETNKVIKDVTNNNHHKSYDKQCHKQ